MGTMRGTMSDGVEIKGEKKKKEGESKAKEKGSYLC